MKSMRKLTPKIQSLTELHDEILLRVFMHLDPISFFFLAQCNKQLNMISRSDELTPKIQSWLHAEEQQGPLQVKPHRKSYNSMINKAWLIRVHSELISLNKKSRKNATLITLNKIISEYLNDTKDNEQNSKSDYETTLPEELVNDMLKAISSFKETSARLKSCRILFDKIRADVHYAYNDENNNTFLSKQAPEILQKQFSYLNKTDLFQLSLVNKKCRAISLSFFEPRKFNFSGGVDKTGPIIPANTNIEYKYLQILQALSPRGDKFAFALDKNTIRIQDVDGESKDVDVNIGGTIFQIKFSPDGMYLYFVTNEGYMANYNIDNAEMKISEYVHDSEYIEMFPLSNRNCIVKTDKDIYLYNESLKKMKYFRGKDVTAVSTASLSPDESFLLVRAYRRCEKSSHRYGWGVGAKGYYLYLLYDTRTCRVTDKFRETLVGELSKFKLCNNNYFIAYKYSHEADVNRIYLWDISKKKCIAQLNLHYDQPGLFKKIDILDISVNNNLIGVTIEKSKFKLGRGYVGDKSSLIFIIVAIEPNNKNNKLPPTLKQVYCSSFSIDDPSLDTEKLSRYIEFNKRIAMVVFDKIRLYPLPQFSMQHRAPLHNHFIRENNDDMHEEKMYSLEEMKNDEFAFFKIPPEMRSLLFKDKKSTDITVEPILQNRHASQLRK